MAQLREIAHVQMGLSFRSRFEAEREGNVAVIQMRDLAEGRRLDHSCNLASVIIEDVDRRHFVKSKDLVFRSRGKTTTAAVLEARLERTIVAAPLLRIRVTSERVLPEYLCWFINQSSSQSFLHSRATGTAVVMIGKSVLDALEVPIPDHAEQKKIVALAVLSDKERRLMSDLAEQRKRLIAGLLAMQFKGSSAPFRPGVAGREKDKT